MGRRGGERKGVTRNELKKSGKAGVDDKFSSSVASM